jgi:hypothetical protein
MNTCGGYFAMAMLNLAGFLSLEVCILFMVGHISSGFTYCMVDIMSGNKFTPKSLTKNEKPV